jgi:DNA-binding CsgD family transcriptional regulator
VSSARDYRLAVTLDLVGPFVARERELGILDDALRARRSVMLVGEPGSGRSRLLDEYVRTRTPRYVRVRGLASLRAVPLGALLAAVGDPPDINPLAIVNWATDTLADCVGAGGMVVVDDLDRLDDVSAGVLRLVHRLHRVPTVMTLASSTTPSDDLLAAWRDGSCWRIDLLPLTADETRKMVESLLGRSVSPHTARRMWAVTLGNPLFVRELVHEGIEFGRLASGAGGDVWEGPMGWGRRIRDVVLSQLTEAPRDLVRSAAMLALGAPLRWSAAEALVGSPAVDELEVRGIVTADGDLVRFTRPLAQQALDASLSRTARRRAIARLVDSHAGIADLSLTEQRRLAEWSLESSTAPNPNVLLMGARAAVTTSDLPSAKRFAARVIRSDPANVEARELLATVLEAAGRHADTVELLADHTPSDDAARLQWGIRYATNTFLAGAQREEAVRVLAGLVAPSGREGEAEATRSWIELFDGDVRTAAATAHQVLDDPRSSKAAVVWASVSSAVAGSLAGDARRADLDLAVGASLLDEVSLSLPFVRLQIGMATIVAKVMTGRWHEAVTQGALVDVDDPTVAAGWFGFRALAAKEAGDLSAARGLLVDCLALLGESDPFQFRRLAITELAACHAVLGDLHAAQRALVAADEDRVPPGLFRPLELRNRAWVAAAGGQRSATLALLHESKAEAARTGQHTVEALAIVDAARLAAVAPSDDEVERLCSTDWPTVATLVQTAVAISSLDAAECVRRSAQYEAAGARLLAGECAAAAAVADGRHVSFFRRVVNEEQRRWATTLRMRALGGVDPLTPREAEIARLAASGHSSPAIAALMSVSVRTVDNHLGRVYRKLGVSGRTSLAELTPDVGR